MRMFCERCGRDLAPDEWWCPDHPYTEPTMDIYPADVELFDKVATEFLARLDKEKP
jgi:hypothetical protein